jgi:predicted DNA-binding transcriptional regulator AlpA
MEPICKCDYCRRKDRVAVTRPPSVEDRLLVLSATQGYLGNRSRMWVWRHATEPMCRFPKTYYLGRSPCWYLSDLNAWIASIHAKHMPGPTHPEVVKRRGKLTRDEHGNNRMMETGDAAD